MYLKREEKLMLWRKYKQLGLSSIESERRMEKFKIYLNEIVKTMKKQEKTKEEINQKFKEEFWKMYQKLEV